MSTSPLVVDRMYVISFERGDQVFAEIYMERSVTEGVNVEIAADNEADRFLLFVLLGYGMAALKQQEDVIGNRVKMLSWEQILRSVADERGTNTPPDDEPNVLPF